MLQKTKSIYFLKRLFTFVDEKNKLDIIKYNKNMQNILDISLINYKTFSGRYILYGKNGKGKEYNFDDKLLFEGEYINRKRNGKGKEYDENGLLMFEGEYINGKRNGKGKEYYFNGKLAFEGEYLNGKKSKGKRRQYIGYKLVFEGEYLNGKIWNGKGYNINGKIEFEINNGKGYVKEYNDKGEISYKGE